MKIPKTSTKINKPRKQFKQFVGFCTLGIAAFGPFCNVIAQEALKVTENNSQDNQNIVKIDYSPALSIAAKSDLRIDTKRDTHRHPIETLAFFGIKPSDKVIEIWPGQGWYSTILAPFLKAGNGQLIAAHFDVSTTNSQLVKDLVENYKVKYTENSNLYGNVDVVPFGPRSRELGEKNSVDAVLTFRNIHNWMNQGWADKAFDDFFKVLKPGGILGIEEHRADEDSPQDPSAADGYVREDYVIDMALEAGFEFVGASQINSNPKDTKDHPFGVWTLPPVLRTAPQGKPANSSFDQSKYLAIGESDRMTLLFRKPIPKPPLISAEKLNKFNPVKVIFGDSKAKANNKKIKADEERQILAAKEVEIKPPIVPPVLEPEKTEIKPQIKADTKIDEKPVLPIVTPVSVPVKFAENPKKKEEIKPPVIGKPDEIKDKVLEPVKTDGKNQDLPDFTIPIWKDVENPAQKKETEVEKSIEAKTEELKKPDEVKSKKINPPKIAKVINISKPDAKEAKTKAELTTKIFKKEVSQTSAKTKETAKKAPAKPSAKTSVSKKPASKTSSKTPAKEVVQKKTDAKKVPAKQTNTKSSTKQTAKITKAPIAKEKASAKKAPNKPDAKTTKPKAGAKSNANVPDWVDPKKKKK